MTWCSRELSVGSVRGTNDLCIGDDGFHRYIPFDHILPSSVWQMTISDNVTRLPREIRHFLFHCFLWRQHAVIVAIAASYERPAGAFKKYRSIRASSAAIARICFAKSIRLAPDAATI